MATAAGWVGADINGAAGDNLGTSVAISDDGQRVVIGSPNDDTNGTNTGTVRVLDWNGSAWTDAETPLNGDTNNERLGAAVSLSGNGDTITASAIPDGTTAPGQVTVHNSDTNPVDPGRPLKLDFQTTYSETGPIQYVGPSCGRLLTGLPDAGAPEPTRGPAEPTPTKSRRSRLISSSMRA